MRRLALTAILLTGLTGCEVFSQLGRNKVDNPVMGPPPPRRSLTNREREPSGEQLATTTAPRPEEFQTVGLTRTYTGPDGFNEMPDNQVVATVNGRPIFAGEVLDSLDVRYKKALEAAPKEEAQKARLQLVQAGLPNLIDRQLLVQALKSTLPEKGLEMLEKHVREAYEEKELEKLRKEFKVQTVLEIREKLTAQGTSLEEHRQSFELRQMALEYLMAKAKQPEVGRQELQAYYAEHREDFFQPGRVKWQQILVSFQKPGGRTEALQSLNDIVGELQQGRDFAAVARDHSDGPTAKAGGEWDWTEMGGLANEQIEKALWELPPGKISEVFVTGTDFQLVRVLERQTAHHRPFEEVQQEIQKQLDDEAKTRAIRSELDQLREQATIETIFDQP